MIQEMSFKDISYLELWQPLFQRSKTIRAILLEDFMRKKTGNYFEFGPVVKEEKSFEDISYLKL